MRDHMWIATWIGAAAMLVALALAPVGVSSADKAPTIGVPDFLVRDSVPDIPDLIPGSAAADAQPVQAAHLGQWRSRPERLRGGDVPQWRPQHRVLQRFFRNHCY